MRQGDQRELVPVDVTLRIARRKRLAPECKGPIRVGHDQCHQALMLAVDSWCVMYYSVILRASTNTGSDQISENGKHGGQAMSLCLLWTVSRIDAIITLFPG